MILIGCYDGYVYAINQTSGDVVWRFNTGGRINSNPVVSNDLAFISLDAQSYGEPYETSKVQKILIVIDLEKKKAVERFTTKTRWHENALVFGKTVYFFDQSTLNSYDAEHRKLSWEIKAPPGMLPYPIVSDSTITLAVNYLGHHGEHQSKVVIYERSTGQKLTSAEKGGIGMRDPHYIQYDKYLVTTDWALNAYEMKNSSLSPRNELKAPDTFDFNRVKPLPHDRIRKNEDIDLKRLCQALIGPQTALRAGAASYLGWHGSNASIPYLIDALADESYHVKKYLEAGMHTTRYRANESLKKLTGKDFGFIWNDPKEKRDKAIKKWQNWWMKNKSVLLVKAEPGNVKTELPPDILEKRN